MNRRRNGQPRPGRDNSRGGRRANDSRPNYHSVPTIQQVIVGAPVSIVLKQDQPTGREVQGIVQDLLTRGDHPRGIKVRLQDGRVGRVQRMGDSSTMTSNANTTTSLRSQEVLPPRMRNQRTDKFDEHHEDDSQGLPPRTLADFLPESEGEPGPGDAHLGNVTFSTATAKCPICGLFEGDEIAVSRHVEGHLT
ncbi:Hypothetical predicted protein [Lecanosticta acicola]|uniref:UBZ4-type domain-containing protein n=1 Tax=Lecanosticta acicola TaxID=111012 RepID=A0AAI8YZW6_9PEZI|nr:Hypothetical predicted protein [Lecanosticta acicola]